MKQKQTRVFKSYNEIKLEEIKRTRAVKSVADGGKAPSPKKLQSLVEHFKGRRA